MTAAGKQRELARYQLPEAPVPWWRSASTGAWR
jgi:hypothetical protein